MAARATVVGVVAAVALVLSACGGRATAGRGPGLSGSITVLAAASLTESFDELGRRFEAAHPGVDVTFGFDASSTLVHQVKAGAPADVLATADEATMQQAVDAGAVASPTVFARNRLAIVVARGNPKGVRSLRDLSRTGLIVVLCAPGVPCGRLGSQVLDRAGVKVDPRSLELNVKGVVSKVVLGEADAGIVYATDIKAAGDKAEGVDIPPGQNVSVSYPIATLGAPRNRAVAEAFTAFVRSEEGRSVLVDAGFDPGL